MPVIDVDSDRLHFTEEGEGPLVIMAHGSCGGARQWTRFAEALGPGWRKVCVDLMGMGESEPFPLERTWTNEDDTRAMSALIAHLDAPFHFVGHSAGGMWHWPALNAHADRVLSLTLFEPVFFSLLQEIGDPLEDWPRSLAVEFRRLMLAGDVDGAMVSFVDRWARGQGVWSGMPDKAREMMLKGAGRLYHEWGYRLQEAPDFVAADMVRPEAPTLLIQGSETVPAAARVCDLFAKARPGVERHEITGAGHMAPFTHAGEAAAATLAHLGRGTENRAQ